ncbi:hypothetical protein J4456_00025 [Candidatus Pacearchaeota archaeon]|nr:hypothetical protein [Candidatus Pacearchaeota archaeon]
MITKIKKIKSNKPLRVESQGDVKEVIIKEGMDPTEERILICFRGAESSGIIEFKTDELEDIFKNIQNRLHVIKGFKKIIN